jgi:glucosamine-6-phosphate deaminase
MRINPLPSEKDFDRTAAWRIISQILKKPDSVIGLSTGQTTVAMHGIVAEIYRTFPFFVDQTTFFNVDEIVPLPLEFSGTCYARIRDQLVKPLGIRDENFIMPPTISDDFDRECDLFEERLARRGGVDLQILGIGTNGHIGINQPGTPFEQGTWVSPLDPETEARFIREAGLASGTRLGGLTRGIKNIMSSRKIILVAKGIHKATIISKALFGPVTPEVPASVLQLHPDCEVLLDAEAASEISGQRA